MTDTRANCKRLTDVDLAARAYADRQKKSAPYIDRRKGFFAWTVASLVRAFRAGAMWQRLRSR